MSRWFHLNPQRATEKGYRPADVRAPLYDRAEIARFVEWAERSRAELGTYRTNSLAPQDRHSLRLLETHLAGALRTFGEGGEVFKSPSFYLQAGLDGLEALLLRYSEPPWEKLTTRLEAFPRLLLNAQDHLSIVESPSKTLALEMAEESLEGLREQYDHQGVPSAVREASWECFRALDRYVKWLDQVESVEFQPMGEEALDRMLLDENFLERPSARWGEMARAALSAIPLRNEHSAYRDSRLTLSREEAWQYFLDEVHRVEAFVRKADIVSIPDGELKLCQTPAYLASLIPGAYYQEPALFAGERTGIFFLPSLPDEWSFDIQQRYIARQNRGGFANLVVHEAWPGHHLQYLHAAKHHDPLANVRDNDVMLEGWALYCEQLMEELGLFERKPFVPRLDSLRMRLARVIVDVGLHTGRMSVPEAENFMAEALGTTVSPWLRAEVRRYCLEPGQPMSYWLGLVLIQELKDELEIGQEDLKGFHDGLLRWGPIPIPLIRERLLNGSSRGVR